jgi:hypothetical protein
MEKYGVVLNDDKNEKTASNGCPNCGTSLDENKHCPDHGTEPFEKRPKAEPKKK